MSLLGDPPLLFSRAEGVGSGALLVVLGGGRGEVVCCVVAITIGVVEVVDRSLGLEEEVDETTKVLTGTEGARVELVMKREDVTVDVLWITEEVSVEDKTDVGTVVVVGSTVDRTGDEVAGIRTEDEVAGTRAAAGGVALRNLESDQKIR